MSEKLKTGTTTIGIACKDCIVLLADKRATAGYFVANKNVDKVIDINGRIAVTTAGSVSDIQLLVKYLRAEIKLKELRTGVEMSVKEVANMLSGWVFSNIRQYIPGVTHFLLAGNDGEGVELYDIFPDGSLTRVSDFVSSGSGSNFAYGLLESGYKKDLSEKEGIELGLKAINSALQRDIATGNGVDVVVIDKNGVRKVMTKKINTGISN